MSGPAVYIETYGCAFNASDGESMAGVLARAGYRVVREPALADVIILNTCTVKDRTYREFEKRFRTLKEASGRGEGPCLVVAGCIPKAYEHSDLLAGVAALGPETIGQVDAVVREALAGHAVQRVRPVAGEDGETARALLPAQRLNPVVEILPIASGCLSACTFCQTRLARGRLVSFRPGDILHRARRAIAEGVKELWVTAQDTGAYGKDCDYPLPRLLGELCALEGDFRVRLGMSSPQWIHAALPATLDALAHPKMFRFLHVPVQSGSDRVLGDMRRGNTAAQFLEVCDAFHERFPEGALMTDVIAGFPTEGEEDFAATLALLERARPAATNCSKFSPRPGTPAARLDGLPGKLVAERSRRLTEAVRRLARACHAPWLGQHDKILVAEVTRNGTAVGHNDAYRPVLLPGPWPLGEWLEVKYNGFADFHLKAEPVDQKP